MRNTWENILSMLLAVRNVLTTNLAKITPIASFLSAYQALVADIAVIETLQAETQQDIKGITITKTEARNLLVSLTRKVQAGLLSYAVSINNQELKESINFKNADYNKARDTDLVAICSTVYTQANANAAALVPFGIVQADIDAILAQIAVFELIISKPREAIVGREVKLKELREQLDFAVGLLKQQIDVYMELFRESEAEFYNNYFTAREIGDNGVRTVSIRGKVYDYVRGVPIEGVSVKLVESGKEVVTRGKGNYQFKSLHAGVYTIVAAHEEYQQKQYSSIAVEEGKITNKDIYLIRKDEDSLIRPEQMKIAWQGVPQENVMLTIRNRSYDNVQIWVYITNKASDALPAEKTIIDSGSMAEFILIAYGYTDNICFRVFNPSTDKLAIYQVALQNILPQ